MAKQRASLANSANLDAAEQGPDGLTTGNMLAIPAGVTKGGSSRSSKSSSLLANWADADP
jgi:hypothetical protein